MHLLLLALLEPGSAWIVLRDGKVLERRVEGYADTEAGKKVTAKTNFRLASVTKQFTAAAILLLERDGKLQLADPVANHLPEWPPYARAVTLLHLLQHESGLRAYDAGVADGTPQLRDSDVLRFVQGQTSLLFDAGTGYRYSNTGYAILALIVEAKSGLRFGDFLRRRIFAPLGMKNTLVHEEGRTKVRHRAFGHSRVGAGWKRDDQSPTSAVQGDGGVYSSIDDLTKWAHALDRCRLLDCGTWQRAWTASKHGYGLGWRVETGRVSHTGSTRGFRTVIQRYPARRLTVIVLTNRNEGEPQARAEELAASHSPATLTGLPLGARDSEPRGGRSLVPQSDGRIQPRQFECGQKTRRGHGEEQNGGEYAERQGVGRLHVIEELRHRFPARIRERNAQGHASGGPQQAGPHGGTNDARACGAERQPDSHFARALRDTAGDEPIDAQDAKNQAQAGDRRDERYGQLLGAERQALQLIGSGEFRERQHGIQTAHDVLQGPGQRLRPALRAHDPDR
ncbi:MAG: beta-lactamase family protein [Acidobacteria bacterium]|nr:beta-lactamase family protein [Acidobacteriota bacterium]